MNTKVSRTKYDLTIIKSQFLSQSSLKNAKNCHNNSSATSSAKKFEFPLTEHFKHGINSADLTKNATDQNLLVHSLAKSKNIYISKLTAFQNNNNNNQKSSPDPILNPIKTVDLTKNYTSLISIDKVAWFKSKESAEPRLLITSGTKLNKKYNNCKSILTLWDTETSTILENYSPWETRKKTANARETVQILDFMPGPGPVFNNLIAVATKNTGYIIDIKSGATTCNISNLGQPELKNFITHFDWNNSGRDHLIAFSDHDELKIFDLRNVQKAYSVISNLPKSYSDKIEAIKFAGNREIFVNYGQTVKKLDYEISNQEMKKQIMRQPEYDFYEMFGPELNYTNSFTSNSSSSSSFFNLGSQKDSDLLLVKNNHIFDLSKKEIYSSFHCGKITNLLTVSENCWLSTSLDGNINLLSRMARPYFRGDEREKVYQDLTCDDWSD